MPTILDFGPFARLPEDDRRRLVAAGRLVDFPAGATLLREGDPPDDAFALLAGRVRVHAGPERKTLATLVAPALIGEMAAIDGRPRIASVLATAPVRALRLPAGALRDAAAGDPGFADELQAFSEARAIRTFLQRDSPFNELPAAAAAELAARLELVRFAVGDVLIREGERGDDAYLLRAGEVEVERGDPARRVAVSGAGAIIGEVSALTGEPRTATVRARTDVEAFRISGEHVRPIVRRYKATVERLEGAMRSRHAPRRTGRPRIEPSPDDPASVIVHDDASGAYLRLGREALSIYEDLDGERSMRDLAMLHFQRTGALDPQGVFETVATFQAAGLVSAPRIASDEPNARLMRLADAILAPRIEVASADRAATVLYRVLRPAFTRGGGIAALVVGTVGTVVFIRLFRLASPTDFGLAGIAVAFFGLLFAGLGHEAAHAIATKAEGRRVGRAGIGILWFTPVIYVDTSDAWLIDRRRRALVSLSGPLFNYAAAGVFGVAAALTGGLTQDLMLWLAAVNLVSVVFNLSPLLEFDGYYALSDLTSINALRRKALRFVFRDLVAMPRRPRTRSETGFVAYAAAALGYVLVVSAIVLLGVPGLIDGILIGRVDGALRALFGSVVALILTALLVGPFVGEVVAARSESGERGA